MLTGEESGVKAWREGGGSNGLGGDSAVFKRTKHAGAIVTGERERERLREKSCVVKGEEEEGNQLLNRP